MPADTAVFVSPLSGLPLAVVAAAGGATTAGVIGAQSQCTPFFGAMQVDAPTNPVEGNVFAVFDADGFCDATKTITVNGNANLIDGAGQVVLNSARAYAVFIFDRSQWRRMSAIRLAPNGVQVELAADQPFDPLGSSAAAIVAAAAAYAAVPQLTTDATVTRIQRSPVAVGDVIEVRYIVKVRSTDGSGAVQAAWSVSGGYKRSGGGVLAAAYAAVITNLYLVGAPVGPTLTLNGNTDVDVNVTGIAATPLTWTISEFVL